ncbi:phosphoribosyltransferase [Gordonia soli]|uniref:Phosphoribosyltransferase domain-containing protein n=1 Tax=Gordonia soli NBRC 108243 TaxID=1223545 RepID=M0QGU2_9ACTN|nr:phosphoribosyltransferase family protein [Gordonia soli]GAC67516.1 hypothetical protein GS4_08_01010 [Gordonia soli NBRC 108243]
MSRHIFAGRTYRDRVHAGRLIAERLEDYRGHDLVVVALPRGGVPVAAVVAEYLDAPLDIVLVRKVGVPGQPELAAGAVTGDGAVVRNDDVIAGTGMTDADLASATERELVEVRRRTEAYRGERGAVPVDGKTVIVVDDGIATGATMHAAVRALRSLGAGTVVVAAAVGPPDVESRFAEDADAVVCPSTPASFQAVGAAYDEFDQLTDERVRDLLGRSDRT